MEVKGDKKEEKEMRVKVLIAGRVQGVGFRYWVRYKAEGLRVKGWVRNLGNGRVEAELAGEKERVKKMIKLCKQGPALARVDEIKVKKIGAKWQGSDEFVILKK